MLDPLLAEDYALREARRFGDELVRQGNLEGKRLEMRDDGVEIRREDIGSPVAAALILALNEELAGRYPEEGATHFRLDAEEVAAGRGAFLVARKRGEPLGCGAVRRIDEHTAEIKRMYVNPSARGQGIGRLLLKELEGEGRRLGARRIVLETGERLAEALAIYSRAGFSRIPAFGEYVGSPLSVCMGKELGEQSDQATPPNPTVAERRAERESMARAPVHFAHVSLAEALLKGPPPAGNLAVPVFTRGSLQVELYAPQGHDPQEPHDRDEAYLVARGNGLFFDGDGRHEVEAGSFVFVAAGRPHRFEAFSPDFAVWVFFYGPHGGEDNGE